MMRPVKLGSKGMKTSPQANSHHRQNKGIDILKCKWWRSTSSNLRSQMAFQMNSTELWRIVNSYLLWVISEIRKRGKTGRLTVWLFKESIWWMHLSYTVENLRLETSKNENMIFPKVSYFKRKDYIKQNYRSVSHGTKHKILNIV